MADWKENARKVAELHAEYCKLTRYSVSLIAREFVWLDWIRRGLTVEDLRLWLNEIKERQRRGAPDSLRFQNAIQNVDRAEENIIELRRLKRGRAPATDRNSVLRSSGRNPDEKKSETKAAGQVAQTLLDDAEARRRAAEHLAEFKRKTFGE